jgi:hypothetical protein
MREQGSGEDYIKAESHIPCRSPAATLPLPCLSPTVPKAGRCPHATSGRPMVIHTYHTVPLPRTCGGLKRSLSEWNIRGMAGERHGMCESALRRRFMVCTEHQILSGRSYQGWWNGCNMWHVWGKGEVHTGIWWEKQREWVSTGKTLCRWEDNITKNLQEAGWGVDWIALVQYRDRWRTCVNAVINFQLPKMLQISWLAAKPLAFQGLCSM